MRIHYAGGTGLTGDAIAHALMNLAVQLALNGSAAKVEIPVRNTNGSVGHTTFLIGPTSQIVAESEASAYDELYDDDLVVDMRRQATALEPHQVSPEPAIVDDFDVELDTE